MKKNNLLLKFVMLLTVILSIQSCSSDDDNWSSQDDMVTDWVTVRCVNDVYCIDTEQYGILAIWDNTYYYPDDNNDILTIYNSKQDGQRVLAYFIPGNAEGGLFYSPVMNEEDITHALLMYLEKILTKSPITLTPEIEESIKYCSPVTLQKMWLSKEHLNIEYSYLYADIGIPHTLNLIIKEEATLSSNGILDVEFRHNSNGDGNPNKNGNGSISFELKDIPAFKEGKLKGLRVSWMPKFTEERDHTLRFEDGSAKQIIR